VILTQLFEGYLERGEVIFLKAGFVFHHFFKACYCNYHLPNELFKFN